MTQSTLQIVFKDGTKHWGPVFLKGQKIDNSKELLEVLIEKPTSSLISLNGWQSKGTSKGSWSYPLSQIDKFKDWIL